MTYEKQLLFHRGLGICGDLSYAARCGWRRKKEFTYGRPYMTLLPALALIAFGASSAKATDCASNMGQGAELPLQEGQHFLPLTSA